MVPRVSIIVPAYNHGAYVCDAIESALAQTVPCDVIVVDDGSTDDTPGVAAQFLGRIRYFRTVHQGPCAARNLGIEKALGEFVMFLDADDVIAPTKVHAQLEAFTPEIGWVLCDVRIEDEANGRAENASQRYGYAQRDLGGWIGHKLRDGNFIPIMAPLVRRSVLGDEIRFHDARVPEDYHFWVEVADAARVRYVPEVLATYRKRRTGRSRVPKAARMVSPNLTMPLRLNLGCGTPNTRSWHPINGFVNLDKSLGWRFEDGLGDFVNGSVAGITISHSLMYVQEENWPEVFAEFARVLAPDGVVRITEDETRDPSSARVDGWKGSDPAVTLTHPELVRSHLERAGLRAEIVTRTTSNYHDRSLCQAHHPVVRGEVTEHEPHVFFIEGIKDAGVLFAPHADDETLFAAFTILKYRPRVVVCFGSTGDYGDTDVRIAETRAAMDVLGGGEVDQWSGGNLIAQMRAVDAQVKPVRVWAPSKQASHPDHVAVAEAADAVFGSRVVHYHTYDQGGKVRHGQAVPYEVPWVHQKLRALTRYQTQLQHPRAQQFFTWDLLEYQEAR